MRLHRLEANIQPGNHDSIRLVKRARFRREGFSPRYLKVAVDATDSDGQKRFALRPGEMIRLTLHPYIGPWQAVASSDAAVLRTTGNETSAGMQRWTFEAIAPGSAILRATYPCPSGEACPLEPSIRVDVAAF